MPTKRTAMKPAFGDGPPKGYGSKRHIDPYHHGPAGHSNPMRVDELVHWSAYAAPWVVAFVIIPFAMIVTRLLFGSSVTIRGLGVVLLIVLGGWLAYVVNDEAKPRKRWTRLRVTITVVWIFVIMSLHLIMSGDVRYDFWHAGPDAWWRIHVVVLGAEIFTGAVLALWWTLGAMPAVKGEGLDQHAGEDTLATALGLGTTGPRGPNQVDGPRKLVPLKLRGVSIDALRGVTDLIAVASGTPRTGVRVVEHPNNAAHVDLVMMTEDVLRNMPAAPPPSHPGGSVTEPCDVGLREDNSHVLTTRVMVPDGGQHVITGGKTGGGKTESWMNGEVFELSTRIDVVQLHSDIRKLGATFPDIAPAFARVASTSSGTLKLVIGLQNVITYRMEHVGRHWTPNSRDHYGNRMPAISVTFEEASAVAAYLNTRLREFLETARSAGIAIKMSFQRPSGEILDTDTRAQFGEGECFPMMRDEDVLMVLNEETIMAGARPEIWGPRLPDYAGYFYRECGDFAKHAMPARSWRRTPAALREHIGTWAPRMCWGQGPEGLDAGSAEALGDAWTDLTSGADYALNHGWVREVVETDGPPRVIWIPPRDLIYSDKPESERVVVGTVTVSDVPTKPTKIVTTTDPEPDDGSDNDDDDTEQEIEMARQDLDDVTREVDQEIRETMADDPDAEGEDTPAPPDGWEDPDQYPAADVDLEAGTPLPDGGSLPWPDKVRAAATVLDQMTQGQTRTLRTADILDRWYDTPGVTQAQRPSLHRILNLLVDHGHGSDAGQGRWEIEPTAGRFLREHVGDFAEPSDEDTDTNLADDVRYQPEYEDD